MKVGVKMKLAEFQNLTSEDLEKMDFKDLKHLVSEQGKKLNKRYENIKSDVRSFHGATKNVSESGGRFGVHGAATKKELILEAKREQAFNKSKGSTVKEARAIKEDITKETGKTAREYGKEKAQKRKETLTKRVKARNKGKELSKSQKQKIARESKKAGIRAENNYNERVDAAWSRFKQWHEKNPALSYNKNAVKSQVDAYATGDRQRMSFYATVNKTVEKSAPDVLSTVNKQVPIV